MAKIVARNPQEGRADPHNAHSLASRDKDRTTRPHHASHSPRRRCRHHQCRHIPANRPPCRHTIHIPRCPRHDLPLPMVHLCSPYQTRSAAGTVQNGAQPLCTTRTWLSGLFASTRSVFCRPTNAPTDIPAAVLDAHAAEFQAGLDRLTSRMSAGGDDRGSSLHASGMP